MKLISIVIPIYNEEHNIVPLFHAIKESIPKKYAFEIIFINDGSMDGSLLKIQNLKKEHPEIKLISFTRNFGHQAAIFAGLTYCKGDAVITMDGDFQDPPDLLPQFIKAWEEGCPLVLGRRKIRTQDSFLKKLTAKTYYHLLAASSNTKSHKHVGDFRLMDKKIVKILLTMPSEAKYIRGIISWLGFNYVYIDYERPARKAGDTKYSFSQMFSLALDGLFNFSNLPLKFGLVLGMLSIAMGMLFMGYIIYDTIYNQVVYPLYKWLVVVILMFIGLLFILFWILAEYISRIYNEKQNRPLFIIDEENSFTGS